MSSAYDHVDPYRAYLYGPTPDDSACDWLPNTVLPHYSSEEAGAVMAELERLFAAYQAGFILGARHSSPSPTWRDESVSDVSKHELSRFATRVHVFEEPIVGSEHTQSAGRYLGFVCLRPPKETASKVPSPCFEYVIEAELVRPRHMFRPRYHLVHTTTSAPRLGVLPFVSTAFMTPRTGVAASTCVHLAISQALHLVMGRFGAKPISQREFEVCLWHEANGTKTIEEVAKEGVGLRTALKVIEDNCRVGGFTADFSEHLGFTGEVEICREAHRCLTDTLANGLPVILMVDHNHLIPGPAKRPPEPHAAFIFGMRLLHSGHEISHGGCEPGELMREDEAELPGTFIGHDSIRGPYVEWSAKHILASAMVCPPLPGDPEDVKQIKGIRFLALGPHGMKIGLPEVRQLAVKLVLPHWRADPTIYEEYHRNFGHRGTDANPTRWRFVTRLLAMHEVLKKYLHDNAPSSRAALAEAFRDVGASMSSDMILKQVGYCWAVELYLPAYRQLSQFGQDPPSRPQPLLVLLWSIRDSFVVRPAGRLCRAIMLLDLVNLATRPDYKSLTYRVVSSLP